MKRFPLSRLLIRMIALSLLGVMVLFNIRPLKSADAASVFPGLYPALTYSGAEAYQQQVNTATLCNTPCL
jgi:hypothetical protein